MLAIGLDGCPGGWVVCLHTIGSPGICFFRVDDDRLGEVFAAASGGAVVAIDMPIGLATSETRACDRAARRRLGRHRQSSVFSAPCRGTIAATGYREACTINVSLSERSLSRQSWELLEKIGRVDRLVGRLDAAPIEIWEAHPEVTFAELSRAPHGLAAGKKTLEGERQRLELLARRGLDIDLTRLRAELGHGVRRDDIVDAAACLVTAERIATGDARYFPDGVAPRDAMGRRMQIAA